MDAYLARDFRSGDRVEFTQEDASDGTFAAATLVETRLHSDDQLDPSSVQTRLSSIAERRAGERPPPLTLALAVTVNCHSPNTQCSRPKLY